MTTQSVTQDQTSGVDLRDVISTRYLTGKGQPRSVRWDENGVPRDQWGRPVIVKADGTVTGYTRISSLAKELDDGHGLTIWKSGVAAMGVSMSTDIRDALALLSVQPWDQVKTEVYRLAEAAQELAGARAKAELGTELHHWTEVYDRTGDITIVPDEYRRDLDAYMWATTEMNMLATEVFVVVDEIEAAGTFDRTVRTFGSASVRIADLKTGQWDRRYPMAVEMQTAMYAHGDVYDLTTGARVRLGADLSSALLIHMPSGSGRCDVYDLDIERGWRNVLLALQLRAVRKESNRTLQPIVSAS